MIITSKEQTVNDNANICITFLRLSNNNLSISPNNKIISPNLHYNINKLSFISRINMGGSGQPNPPDDNAKCLICDSRNNPLTISSNTLYNNDMIFPTIGGHPGSCDPHEMVFLFPNQDYTIPVNEILKIYFVNQYATINDWKTKISSVRYSGRKVYGEFVLPSDEGTSITKSFVDPLPNLLHEFMPKIIFDINLESNQSIPSPITAFGF